MYDMNFWYDRPFSGLPTLFQKTTTGISSLLFIHFFVTHVWSRFVVFKFLQRAKVAKISFPVVSVLKIEV